MSRASFGRKPFDLSIFTFDEQLNDKLMEENVKAKSFGKIIMDGIKLVDDHIRDDFVNVTRTTMLVGCDKKFFGCKD